MANGSAALHVALEPAPQSKAAPTRATADATTEVAIGAAVASAACVVAQATQDYRQWGELDPRTKVAGGERIAKVALLQLDHGLGDIAFADIAREQGKIRLRQYLAADDFYCHHSTEQGEAALDLAIDSVLEITAKVVREERTFRAAWAN